MGLLYTPLEQFGTIDTHKYSWVKYPVLCDWEYKTEMFLWIHLCILLELLFPCPSPHKMLIEILHSHLFPYGINWHLGKGGEGMSFFWELGIGTLLPNYIAVFLLLINEYKTQTQNHFREIPFRIKALSEECWQMLTFLLKNEDHPPHHS